MTVLSRTHLPFARVLAESLREHHQGLHLTVVLVDQLDPRQLSAVSSPGDMTITPLDLGLSRRELHRRALIYDTQGLISSLRPLAMRHVLGQGADAVLLLDADLLALGPLDDLWELSAEYGVLLSPHTTRALGDQDTIAREENYLLAGTFNGGVLGVGAGASAFLEWMAARVARDCVLDRSRGLQYSQTWLNLVPSLFHHHVMLDPGVNVTAHRLAGRDLEGTAERPELDGALVRLLHFTGFDPAETRALCRHLPGPEDSLEHRPRMAAWCVSYAERLRRRGWPEGTGAPWSHLACEVAVDSAVRTAYRGALLAAERGYGVEPPDPFEPAEAERFSRWLTEPPSELPRYLLALWSERPDLCAAFPRGLDEGLPDLLAWWQWQIDKAAAGSEDLAPELLRLLSSASRSGDEATARNGRRRLNLRRALMRRAGPR